VLAIRAVHLRNVSSYLCCCIDDDDFSPTASKQLEDLVRGCILHCEVTAVEEDGVPYVMLTKVSGNEVSVDDVGYCHYMSGIVFVIVCWCNLYSYQH